MSPVFTQSPPATNGDHPDANGIEAAPPLARGPSSPPKEETNPMDDAKPKVYLGTKRRLPEFILTDKVVLVSGAARGLGLTQAEALLEAGATGELQYSSSFLFSFLQGGRSSPYNNYLLRPSRSLKEKLCM